MAGPLLELAAQYEAEVKALEEHYLAPIAEALSHPDCAQVKPETFAVLAAVRGAMHQLDEDHRLRESLNAKLEAFEAAEASREKRRATAVAKLEAQRDKRRAFLEQVVTGLVELRKLDTPPNDDGFAEYERHIAELRGRYGRDAAIRD
jgi:hypothetical protein